MKATTARRSLLLLGTPNEKKYSSYDAEVIVRELTKVGFQEQYGMLTLCMYFKEKVEIWIKLSENM